MTGTSPGGSIPAWSWHRRALSKWGNRYAAGVLGMNAPVTYENLTAVDHPGPRHK